MEKPTRIDWSNFSKLRNESTRNIEAAVCNSCDTIIKTCTQKRFDKHRKKCEGLKRKEEMNPVESAGSASGPKRPRLNSEPNSKQSPNVTSQLPEKNVIEEEDSILGDDLPHNDQRYSKELVDKVLGMFFFGCAISFRTVEHKYFRLLVKVLSKIDFEYKPPTRQTLAENILSRVHMDIVEKKKKKLQNTRSVILVDGWKNKSVNKKFLVFTLRNMNVSQTFLTFNDTSLEREDAESLAENINNAIKLAKDVYETDVFAIVSDNDAKITAAGRLARTVDNQPLIQTTCSSHSGNLFLKKLVDGEFEQKVRELATAFRDPKMESLLIRLGGTKLLNYPDTRFCYFRDTCKSIQKNLKCMKEISMIEDIFVKENIFETVFDEDFETKLDETIKTLNPVCTLINKCQSPLFNIADAVEEWMKLELPTNDYNGLLRERIQKAIWPAAYASNLLQPKYEGKSLSDNQRNIGIKFLEDHLDESGKSELRVYLSDTDESHNSKDRFDDCISYWHWYSFTLPNLSELAVKLMFIPASTALIESLFSEWTYVHNLYRNRLSNERSGQQIDIYHALKRFDIKLSDLTS